MGTPRQIAANQQNALKSTGPATEEGKALVSKNALKHGMMASIAVISNLERVEDWQEHLQEMIDSISPKGRLEMTLAERLALLSWRMNRIARYEVESIALSQERIEIDITKERQYHGKWNHKNPQDSIEDHESMLLCLRALATFITSDLPADTPIGGEEAESIIQDIAAAGKVDHTTAKFPHIPRELVRNDQMALFEGWNIGIVKDCINFIVDKSKIKLEVLYKVAIEKAAERVVQTEHEAEISKHRINQLLRERLLPEDKVLDRIQRYEAALSRDFFKTLHELQRLQAMRTGQPAAIPTAIDIAIDSNSEQIKLAE